MSLSLSGKGRGRGRKGRDSIVREAEGYGVVGSPGAAKRVRLADGSYVSVGASERRTVDSEKIPKVVKGSTKTNVSGGNVATSAGSVSKKDGETAPVRDAKNSGTSGSANQSPRVAKGGAISKPAAQRSEPDIPFETYVEITSQGKPVPRDKILGGFERLRSTYQFPGQIHMIPGHTILMDRDPGFRMHFGPTQLSQLNSGPDLRNAGKGPAHIFMLVELAWLDRRDAETREPQRAWVVVHFHRGRKTAIIWDFCPALKTGERVATWALQKRGAFLEYSSDVRSCTPPCIPATEWFMTGPAMLCTLRYWLEYFKQYDGKKELTREICAIPNGFTYSAAHAKKIRELKEAEAKKASGQ